MVKKTQKKPQRKNDFTEVAPLLASIREAVIVTDSKGIVLLANPAIEFITGRLPDDFVGKKLSSGITFKCEKENVSSFLKEALRGWSAVKLPDECSITQKGGKEVPVAAIATPLFSPKGEYTGIVLVIRDLTEEVRRKRRQYEFLSFVSHQFRQPLGSLRWGIEVILESPENLSPQNRELLNDLHEITLRFKDFVTDLIDISRIEEGRIDLKVEEINLREVVEQAAQELHGLAVSQNVVITFFPKHKKESFVIKGDKARVGDIFMNLIANAIFYNKPRGNITIDAEKITQKEIERLSVQAHGDLDITRYLENIQKKKIKKFLLVTVADTGIGIPEVDQKNVFEGFFRAENVVKRGIVGTGLGLFIVKAMTERMGGKIFFTSEENKGTTFYLVFPTT